MRKKTFLHLKSAQALSCVRPLNKLYKLHPYLSIFDLNCFWFNCMQHWIALMQCHMEWHKTLKKASCWLGLGNKGVMALVHFSKCWRKWKWNFCEEVISSKLDKSRWHFISLKFFMLYLAGTMKQFTYSPRLLMFLYLFFSQSRDTFCNSLGSYCATWGLNSVLPWARNLPHHLFQCSKSKGESQRLGGMFSPAPLLFLSVDKHLFKPVNTHFTH